MDAPAGTPVADDLPRNSTETITSSPTMTTTSSQAVPANPNRLALFVVNLGAQNVYMTPVGAASSTNGVFMAANGGFISLIRRDDKDLTGYSWQGIAASATSGLFVLETNSLKPFV